MENVIYILIGIAWMIFSAYKANQKKAAKKGISPPRQQPSVNQGGRGSFNEKGLGVSEFIEHLFADGNVSEADTPSGNSYQWGDDLNPHPLQADEISPKSLIDGLKPVYESVEYTKKRTVDVQPVEKFSEAEEKMAANDEIFSFNLRHAVIHQAILNRPYS